MKFQKDQLPEPHSYYLEQVEGFRPKPNNRATGLCPLHNERSPSFSMNLTTGAYKCFGCGKRGGDVLAFHRERYQMEFVEAAKSLGAWA